MKTRNLSLPLVIIATLALGSTVYAQQLAHNQLLTYLEKMPEAPVFPDSITLASNQPTSFEGHEDLIALQKKIQSLGKESSSEGAKIGAIKNTNTTPVISENDISNSKQTLNTLDAELQNLQSIKIEFSANFRRLENIYGQHIEKVDQQARALQISQPCKEDVNCRLLHERIRNNGFISAMREKITNEEYLLSVFINQVKPSFQKLDATLRDANYGEHAATPEAKNLFYGAQQNELMVLNDIIERIKLERIQISNCARLAQQGFMR